MDFKEKARELAEKIREHEVRGDAYMIWDVTRGEAEETVQDALRAAYAAGMREAAVYSSTRFIEASLMHAADAIERGEP